MATLMNYSLTIFPAMVIFAITFMLIPRTERLFRKLILILAFILIRDAMTPTEIWQFGIHNGVIWLRFIESHFVILTLGVMSLFLSLLILRYMADPKGVDWIKQGTLLKGFLVSLLASFLAAGPFILPYFTTPLESRGGSVPAHLLPSLLIFALLGNFLEEVLFRELLQGYFKERITTTRSILLSGFSFSMGHLFLATTVTQLGPLIIIFTLWEGLICAWMREKYGLLATTLTHGLTIFILASGLF